jgi:hypothetical protein
MSQSSTPDAASPVPSCPKCQGPMWDNREGKRNPKAPDFKCKDTTCGGVIWPPRDASAVDSSASPRSSMSSRDPAAAASAAAPRAPTARGASGGAAKPTLDENGMPLCPVCGGPMWDDRASKRNPRAPDFKCRNKPRERGGPGCEGVIWPARDGSPSPYPPPIARRSAPAAREAPPPWDGPPLDEVPPPDDDDLPF